MPPVKISCYLCERPVNKVVIARNYQRRGLNVTIWVHDDGVRCFVADDLYEDQSATGRPETPFEFMPLPAADEAQCCTS